jgi:hypothetical protein
MRLRVLLWRQYLAHVVDRREDRVLVEYQHPSERQRQSIWVGLNEVVPF